MHGKHWKGHAIIRHQENLRNYFHGLVFCTAGYFIKQIVWKHSPYGPVFPLQYLVLQNFDTENVFYFLSINTAFDFSIACVAGGFRGCGRGGWGHRKSEQAEKAGGIKRAKGGDES